MFISGNHFYVDRYRGAVEAISEYGITPAWVRFAHGCGLNKSLQIVGCAYQLPPYEFFENSDEEFIEEQSKLLLLSLDDIAEYAGKHRLEHMTMLQAWKQADEFLYNA